MSSTRFNIDKMLHDMIGAPASTAAVRVMFRTEDGVLDCYGNTVPDGLAGYAIGCIFHHCDGGNGTALYVNEGTALVSDFNAITVGA